MTANEPGAVDRPRWYWTLTYKCRVMRGRITGAFRVLTGKSASIPTGVHNTETPAGRVYVEGYYGGAIISLPMGDLYWKAKQFDGWGAGPGQEMWPTELDDDLQAEPAS